MTDQLLDIHYDKKRLEKLTKDLDKGVFKLINGTLKIKLEDKKALKILLKKGKINRLSIARQKFYLEKSSIIFRISYKLFDKPVSKLSLEELEDLSLKIKDKYNGWTVHSLSVCLRRFIQVYDNEETGEYSWDSQRYPKRIDFLKAKKDEGGREKRAEDILTIEDYQKLISVCNSDFQRGLIACLFWSIGRPKSILSLKYRDVTFDAEACYVTLRTNKSAESVGKVRKNPIVFGYDHMINYWKNHPTKKPTDPFWISNNSLKNKKITAYQYRALVKFVHALGKRAKIKKKIIPYSFRDAGLNYYAKDRKVSRAVLSSMASWTPSSKAADYYFRINDKAVQNAVMESHGKKMREQPVVTKDLMTNCGRCGFGFNTGENYCSRCSFPLNAKTMVEVKSMKKEIENKKEFDKWINDATKDVFTDDFFDNLAFSLSKRGLKLKVAQK